MKFVHIPLQFMQYFLFRGPHLLRHTLVEYFERIGSIWLVEVLVATHFASKTTYPGVVRVAFVRERAPATVVHFNRNTF